jgi:hypothetical protein
MANNDTTNDVALPLAFSAATTLGFELFFSFDYAGNGPWDKSVVTDMINSYGPKPAYHNQGLKSSNTQPFLTRTFCERCWVVTNLQRDKIRGPC